SPDDAIYYAQGSGDQIEITGAGWDPTVNRARDKIKNTLQNDAKCYKWLETAYKSSSWSVYGSFETFLDILGSTIGAGNFSGAGAATTSAVYGSPAPNFVIIV